MTTPCPLTFPTFNEAPLVALVTLDVSKLSDTELASFQAQIRELRAVPAAKAAAVTKSKKSVESKINLDSLL